MTIFQRLASAFLLTVLGACPAWAADRIMLPGNVHPSHYDLTITPDTKSGTFSGIAKIDIDIASSTKTIVLNAAQLRFKTVSLSGVATAPAISFDTDQETATFTFSTAIAAGKRVLTITYDGVINDHASGLFQLIYDTPRGKKSALYTQFENSDARRFVPCWDEPAQKATFTLTAIVPADRMAISNTPIERSEMLKGGRKRVHFAATPKMSTYLLFFGLGDFERVTRKVDGVEIGVVVKRGDTDKTAFALDAAAHLLPYYEEYFGVKYPLAKLDLVAAPGGSQFFGAMENWGAIFYFERELLVDKTFSTEAEKRDVYIVIAHEMAHQWFGDLVTMNWWDDLWLNEGFASWMEVKATDHFHPEWGPWLNDLEAREGAMRTDARAGTHPIITPIANVLQANEAFDEITYNKGQSVIRMLETSVGEDTFRAGVRAYIAAHAYGNTTTDDLWRELDKIAKTPITPIAHDFTKQSGIPLIRVAPAAGGVRLTQDRFTVDGSGDAAAAWSVPVIAKSVGASAPPWQGVVSRTKPANARVAAPVIVNAGQSGYFRTLYAPKALAPLRARFADMAPADQWGLLADAHALGYAGYEPLSDFLSLAHGASPAMDPLVLGSVAERLEGVARFYDGLPGRSAFATFTRGVLNPAFAQVGWSPRAGEGPNVALLRESLVDALSAVDDPAIIDGARQRFAAFVKDRATLSGDLRSMVLNVVAEHADAATWEQLHQLARTAPSNVEKRRLYVLLGQAQDTALADRALALALTNELPVTLRPSLIGSVSGRYPDRAFAFVDAHWKDVSALLEPDSRNQFGPDLLANSHDLGAIEKLRAFAARNIAPEAMSQERKTEAAVAYAAKIRAERLPQVDQWIRTNGG